MDVRRMWVFRCVQVYHERKFYHFISDGGTVKQYFGWGFGEKSEAPPEVFEAAQKEMEKWLYELSL